MNCNIFDVAIGRDAKSTRVDMVELQRSKSVCGAVGHQARVIGRFESKN